MIVSEKPFERVYCLVLSVGYHLNPLQEPRSDPAGRVLTSDWSINSFTMVVYEKQILSRALHRKD